MTAAVVTQTQQQNVRSKGSNAFEFLDLVMLYLCGWNLWAKHVFHPCFQRWHDEADRKIKTDIIGVDKKLWTKIIVCLCVHVWVCVCICVCLGVRVCLSILQPKEWENVCWVQTEKIEWKKTAESRWTDLQRRYWQFYRQKIGCISDTILDFGQRKIWSLTSIQMVSHFWPLTQLLLFLNIGLTVIAHVAGG